MGLFSRKKKNKVEPIAPYNRTQAVRPIQKSPVHQEKQMTEEQARRFAQALSQMMRENDKGSGK